MGYNQVATGISRDRTYPLGARMIENERGKPVSIVASNCWKTSCDRADDEGSQYKGLKPYDEALLRLAMTTLNNTLAAPPFELVVRAKLWEQPAHFDLTDELPPDRGRRV